MEERRVDGHVADRDTVAVQLTRRPDARQAHRRFIDVLGPTRRREHHRDVGAALVVLGLA